MTVLRWGENVDVRRSICPIRMRRSGQSRTARESRWSSFPAPYRQREYRHLGGRAVLLVHGPNGREANFVAEARARGFCPADELGSGPLEAMICMTQLSRRKRGEQNVVFPVVSCYHAVARPRALTYHTCE